MDPFTITTSEERIQEEIEEKTLAKLRSQVKFTKTRRNKIGEEARRLDKS